MSDLSTLYNDRFTDFLDSSEKYGTLLSELIVKGSKHLVIDFKDLADFDMEYAESVLKDPRVFEKALPDSAIIKLSMRGIDASELTGLRVSLRNLPIEIPLREVGAEHIGTLIQLSGIVVKATKVQPYLVVAAWQCSFCLEFTQITQVGTKLMRPSKCSEVDCSGKKFTLSHEESMFINSQVITLQERPEELPPGRLPRDLRVQLRGALVDQVRPGDRVVVNGIVKLEAPRRTGRVFKFVIEGCHVETSDHEDLEITEEDLIRIMALSRDPRLQAKIVVSFAPSIFGHETVKEAIIYQIFGGEPKQEADIRIRGDMNVALVGDPGTAKTQLLMAAVKIHPRGFLTGGKGSSAAGLTASVSRESGTGEFVLEAGALVLGDMGLVAIDEFDKMDPSDREAIHLPMEQQIVPIAKGGIVATLNARTSVLVAANPVLGRYNPYQTVSQNINLSPTVLSRFDLVFIIRDIPEKESDKKLAHHILGIHRKTGEVTTDINPGLLKKYITHAKKNIHPKLNQEASDLLETFFVEMRSASLDGGEAAAISISARQLESCIRISEARARMHLREEATLEDALAAKAIMLKSLAQVGIDAETGEYDIDILLSGKPRSLQTMIGKVLGAIASMESMTGQVRDEDLFTHMSNKHGMARPETGRFIGVLMRDGTIFSPRPGYYKRVG